MKRLIFASAMLAAIFCAVLCSGRFLGRLTGSLSGLLTQAEQSAEQGDWAGAEALTRQARAQWEQQDLRLHITLRHADIDQIHTAFQEVLEFITCRESGEYSAANARLIAQLELLCEAEQLTLKNVL